MKCLKIIVKGIVQGVGFRYFCLKNARELNIGGYAKNLLNGDVEVIAQGEEGMLNEFIKIVQAGPEFSEVKSISVEETGSENRYNSFRIY